MPRPYRVLIVDDHAAIGFVLTRALRSDERFEPAGTATTLAGAQAALAADPVDAVVLDLMLPDARGSEGPTRIRQLTDAKIVIYSAFSDVADHDAATLADEAVTKGPVQPLLDALASVLHAD